MSRIGDGRPPPKGPENQRQIVDSKYSADLQALDAQEEEAGRRNFKADDDKSSKNQKEVRDSKKPLNEAVRMDEKRRRKKRDRQQGEQDEVETEPSAKEAAAKSLGLSEGRGRLFEEAPEDRLGDLDLVDPDEMKQVLGASARFAQHAMLLAESKRESGVPRKKAIAYLAGLFAGCSDRAYANKALRELGPATGIIEIYPLEVVDHLLQHVPEFSRKISRGSIFVKSKPVLEGVTGEPILLEYPPELKIRGFAVEGGDHIGYCFEPVDPPGSYHLTIATAGKFTLLMSATSKDGRMVVEKLPCEIAQGARSDLGDSGEARAKRESDEQQDSDDDTSKDDADKPDKKKDLTINFPRRI